MADRIDKKELVNRVVQRLADIKPTRVSSGLAILSRKDF